MTDTTTTFSTGSLIDHVEVKLNGAKFPATLRKLRARLFDLSTCDPYEVPNEVRKLISLKPKPMTLKLVLRAAASVLAGHSLVKRHKYISEKSTFEQIIERDSHSFQLSSEEKNLVRREIARGWQHPWRSMSIEAEERQWAAIGRPGRSLDDVVSKVKLALSEIESCRYWEASKLLINAGQAMRTQAKNQQA